MRSFVVRVTLAAIVLSVLPSVATVQVIPVPGVVDATVGVGISTTAALPAAAAVGGASQKPGDAHRSSTIAAPVPFTMIGFELADGIDNVRVRVAGDDGAWEPWYELSRIDLDMGPNPDTVEGRADRSHRFTEVAYVGEATRFQVEVPADEATDAADQIGLEATVLDTEGLSEAAEVSSVRVGGAVAKASTTRPEFVTREEWGAQAPRDIPTIREDIDLVVVHHTAGSNNYTREQADGLVRGIQNYHRNTLGWDDIGYNALVDRFGTVYEGRAGGLENAVQGAHATGYNNGSFGISVMGDYSDMDAPDAAYEAAADMIAWKAAIHDFDPLGTTDRTYHRKPVRAVVGHRNVGTSACPGRIAEKLSWLRSEAAVRRGSSPQPTTPDRQPDPDASRFPDVPAGSPHRPGVLALDEAGILRGYPDNTYRPANPLTRGQMATIFVRSMGLTPQQPNGEFSDVGPDTTHGESITALMRADVIRGYGDGSFRPNGPVSREQIASYLVGAKGLRPAGPTPWNDVRRTSAHYGSIGTAHREGYIFGFAEDVYLPDRDLRRDEAANMVARAFPPT